MSDQNISNPRKDRASSASKYMSFKLAQEEYGIEILKVRELIGLLEITRVPRTKPYIRGLINLRGKVIPVVDLRAKFGMPPTDPTSQTVIIVVQIGAGSANLTMGVLVDEVLEVRAIAESDIEPPPTLPQDIDTSFILGVGKTDKNIVFLLDIDRVLTVDERSEVLASPTEGGALVEG